MPLRTHQDLTGHSFGDLVVVGLANRRDHRGRSHWIAVDGRGTQHTLRIDKLKAAKVLAGKRRRWRHRMSGTTEFKIWRGMLSRCMNPKDPGYKYYGARGIEVCQRWQEAFSAFYADMGARPSTQHSIDRIDNDGNYEPGNCRWATAAQQAANKRRRVEAPRSRSGA